MTASGIEFRNVTKRYAGPASPLVVKGIDFSIPKGTLTTILGPSGCGKTTTLRMIAGLESPSSGQILINGQDVTRLGAAERNVSMVFQSYALFPHMTVLDNVCYGLTLKGMTKQAMLDKAHAALQAVGLSALDARLPSELSGGQQQRVAVARSLVLEPAVLLFDEPLSNLDARLRRSMREEIRHLQQKLQLTVAYVTHDQSEALAVSDQIIVMNQGEIAQMGSPSALYDQPHNEFVARFIGEASLYQGQADGTGTVQIGSLRWAGAPSHTQGPVTVAVRPQAWRLSSSEAEHTLPATIHKLAYLGDCYEISLNTELGEVFVITHDTQQLWTTGDRVYLTLGQRGVCVLSAQT